MGKDKGRLSAQRQADEERHAALMAVAHSLTTADQILLLGKVARDYPRLQGADVADVLDLTSDYDMFLDRTEVFFERYADQVPDTPALIFAAHAVILLGRGLAPARVWSFLQRAGVVDPPRYPEVEVGLHAGEPFIEQPADANTVTLRARAEQGMRAAGIPEAVITEFRESVRQTDIPGQQFNVGDIARWVTFTDRFTPMPRKVYDPVDDLAVVLAWAAWSAGGPDRPGAVRVEQALANLRSHLALRSVETARASLAAFFGREP